MTTPTDIHSCSYFCTRPACVLAQRDELRDSHGAGNQVPPTAQPATRKDCGEAGCAEDRCGNAGCLPSAQPAAQPVQPQGWQPIETAPKDGTEILMTNGADVSSGQWFAEDDGTCDRDGAPNGDERDAGWMDWSGGMQPDPTHWMALPARPDAS